MPTLYANTRDLSAKLREIIPNQSGMMKDLLTVFNLSLDLSNRKVEVHSSTDNLKKALYQKTNNFTICYETGESNGVTRSCPLYGPYGHSTHTLDEFQKFLKYVASNLLPKEHEPSNNHIQ